MAGPAPLTCSCCAAALMPAAKFCSECGERVAPQAGANLPFPPRPEVRPAVQSGQYNEFVHTQINLDSRAGRTPAEHLSDYLAWLRQTHRALRVNDIIKGVVSTDADPLDLAGVFVDLHTTLRIPKDASLEEHLRRERERSQTARPGGRLRSFFRPAGKGAPEDDEQGTETRPVGVFEPLSLHPRLVLIGDPGSGKSTVGQFLTLALAQARLGDASLLLRLGPTWTHGLPLPVPFVLREFAAGLGSGTEPGRAGEVWDFLRRSLKDCGQEPAWADAIKDTAKTGALFIFDGWDETHDPKRLARVAEALAEFVRNAPSGSRFLLTSRPYAWEAVKLAAADREDAAVTQQDAALARRLRQAFSTLHQLFAASHEVAPLEDPQIQKFIELWYAAVQSGDRPWFGQRAADEKRADLQLAAAREDLQPVVSNPLLLTLTAALSGTHLPDDRADLFNEIVELLLKRWTEASGSNRSLRDELGRDLKLDDLREKIEEAALAAHHGHVGRDGPADIPEASLQSGLASLLGGSADLAAKVINFIERRTGLLIGKGLKAGQRQFSCPHRNLQEFLAGCCLAAKPSFTCTDLKADPEAAPSALLLARHNPGHWREVLAFAARRAKYERGTLAAETLVQGGPFEAWARTHQPTEADWRCAVVAALQIVEIGLDVARSTPMTALRVEHVATWLAGLVERAGLSSLRERVEAAQLLAKLGDPRPGVANPLFAWCGPDPKRPDETFPEPFPAGAFLMGGDPEAYNSSKAPFPCTRIGQPFLVAKYPVTVAQYRLFVQAKGYANDTFWTTEGQKWRDGQADTSQWPEWMKPIKEAYERTPKPIAGPEDYGPAFQTPNHPRVGVSWFEALAFCRWLNATFAPEELGLPEGWVVALPTDAQWERAARWPNDLEAKQIRRFPWGDEHADEELNRRCNWRGTGLGQTSAVGLFSPAGDTAGGLADLAGNVLEWCLSRPVKVDTQAAQAAYNASKTLDAEVTGENVPEEANFRVLRGGSWRRGAGLCRAANRYRNFPVSRNDLVGFRVVASPCPLNSEPSGL